MQKMTLERRHYIFLSKKVMATLIDIVQQSKIGPLCKYRVIFIRNVCFETKIILFYSFQLGHEDIAKLLIDNGADIMAKNKRGQTPLHYSAQFRNSQLTKHLNTKPKRINRFFQYNFFVDREYAARLLIAAGANIDTRDEDGCSPIFVAASSGESITYTLTK